MKSLTESPAILTVHQGHEGQYILRIADIKYRPLLVSVSKLLPGAESLVVVTPSDIKVFAVENNGQPTLFEQPESEVVDPEMQAAIESEQARSIPGESPEPITGAEETPQKAKVVRRKKAESIASHDEQCGRCRGAGKIAIALDNGAASESTCPICKGTGVMKRYGARR